VSVKPANDAEVEALRRQVAERDAALREIRRLLDGLLPARRGRRYADPEAAMKRWREENAEKRKAQAR
jgi:hypothetical protein